MKRLATLWVLLTGAVFVFSSCGHMELARADDPNRVVSGVVKAHMSLLPPPDAELVVRIMRPPAVVSGTVIQGPATVGRERVLGETGMQVDPERVVGVQVIRAPAALPVPFKIDFRADDAELHHGFNIEARLSWGGRVRFRTLTSQVVTADTFGMPVELIVDPVR